MEILGWLAALALLGWAALTFWRGHRDDQVRRQRRAWAEESLRKRHATAASIAVLRRMHIGGYTPGWWGRMLREHKYHCYYCKRHLPHGERFHKEHDIPLSRGGLHHVSNIQPSCARCNLSKGVRTGEEFFAFIAVNEGNPLGPKRVRNADRSKAAGRTTTISEVLAAMTRLEKRDPHGIWGVGEILADLRASGNARPDATLRVTIATMGTRGLIVRVARGMYRLPTTATGRTDPSS